MTTKTLLPINSRISHRDGGPYSHGLGYITGYNGVAVNTYANEKFKDAAEMASKSGLGAAFVSSLYDDERYPYKVTFDNGYSDVYDVDSVRPFTGHEKSIGMLDMKPGVKYSLIEEFMLVGKPVTREDYINDWVISGDITVVRIKLFSPKRGEFYLDTSTGRNATIGQSHDGKKAVTKSFKDKEDQLLYALIDAGWTGADIDFSFDAIFMALVRKPENEITTLFGNSINDYHQVDEGISVVSYDAKATLITKVQ